MLHKLALLIALALAACSREPDDREPSTPASPSVVDVFNGAAARLVGLSDLGWVVSREKTGEVRNEGDSAIWTGMAPGVLDCDRGAVPEQALIKMLDETGGKIYRHPSLKHEVSVDPAIGIYWGAGIRVSRCPDAALAWRAALERNPGFFDDPLNDHERVSLPGHFWVLRDLLGWKLGLRQRPSDEDVRELEKEVVLWAAAVRGKIQLWRANPNRFGPPACFRLNLGLLTLQTLEQLAGPVKDETRNDFCALTGNLDLKTVDHWCGRGDLRGWIKAFEYNRFEFVHQRCPEWEQPDGRGFETPALDLLVAIRAAYDIDL